MSDATAFDLSDIGNADIFCRQHAKYLRYYTARGVWLCWNGKHWADDDSNEVARRAVMTCDVLRDLARAMPRGDSTDPRVKTREDQERNRALQWAQVSRSRERRVALVADASASATFVVRPKDLDADPFLLNTPNGVVDLRTRERKPHTGETRGLLMTRMTSAAFNPDAKSEEWQAFLTTITGGDVELEGYLQRVLGYAIFGAWREKQFWFAFGPPDGGKSTLLSIIGKVLGSYHVTADQSTWMQQSAVGGNRGDIVRLAGARLVTTSEIQPGVKFDSALMKKVTGGDAITAAAKYEGEVSFYPTFALWLAGNDRPSIQASDDGMFRRVRCVPFPHVIPPEKQDRELPERLATERGEAVLAWLVAGFGMWRESGLGTSTAVNDASKAYREAMNPLLDFAEDKLRFTGDPNHIIDVKFLYDEYRQWCYELRPKFSCGRKGFTAAIKALGFTLDETNHDKRVWKGGILLQ